MWVRRWRDIEEVAVESVCVCVAGGAAGTLFSFRGTVCL